MHASSALFDAVVSSERPAREQLTPQTQESKAVSQWKSLFAGHHKRKGRLAPAVETPQPKAKPAEQLYLDFGQRSFGQRQECKTCGLLYTLGQPEDEEMHRRHHRRVVQGISMHPSAADRVVRQLPDGGRTLLILPSDPADRLRKLAEVTALMAAELGGEPSLPRDGRAFLLADSSARRYRLLGCAIAEPLQRAFRALPQDDASGSGVLRHGGIPQPALCGVSHIWVCAAHRRRGVARQLLDAVRCAQPRPPLPSPPTCRAPCRAPRRAPWLPWSRSGLVLARAREAARPLRAGRTC